MNFSNAKDRAATVLLVDSRDREIGLAPKILAHERGLLHRAFSVFLFQQGDSSPEVFLQKRADHKYHCGGLWSNSCCSHPSSGGTDNCADHLLDCAKNRLWQERGIEAQLEPSGSFRYKALFFNGLTEHEIDHVSVGKAETVPKNFNKEEVSEVTFINYDLLHEKITLFPSSFSPWLKEDLSIALVTVNTLRFWAKNAYI